MGRFQVLHCEAIKNCTADTIYRSFYSFVLSFTTTKAETASDRSDIPPKALMLASSCALLMNFNRKYCSFLVCSTVCIVSREVPYYSRFRSLYSCMFNLIRFFLNALAKLRKLTTCFVICLSVRPHGTTRLPREVFLLNLVSENVSKICRETSNFITIWKE